MTTNTSIPALNDKLAGCSFEQEGNDFYIVGADAVRKKLGSGDYRITATFAANVYGGSGWGNTTRFTYTITVQDGKVSCPDLSRSIYNPVAEISWSASEEKKPTIRLESLAISKI